MLDKIKNILERLDYPINYVGQNHVSTTALFRSGDNPLALVAYKDNVWDQIEGQSYTWPRFVAMVKSISLKDAELWLTGIEVEDGDEQEEKAEKIKIQKILVESDYADLVKSYDFFLRRGISKETLDYVGAGLCQGGGFYGRIIFKIRNDKGKLVGVAGRDVLNRGERGVVKWKLKGSKSDWIYPCFERNAEAIRRTGQIIIVESVGDCLSLMDAGIGNVLCNFGLSLSSARLSFILKSNPSSIFVALNDDSTSLENRGQIAAAKIKIKLSTFFAADKIIKAPPIYGRCDFGEMNKDQILNWADSFGVKY
jgi:hypothetical protein